MYPDKRLLMRLGLCAALTVTTVGLARPLRAQSGLRQSLERLDANQNGKIDPDEITSLARPYLERVAKARRMSLERSNNIETIQEAARIYYALQNGVAGQDVRSEAESTVLPFGPKPNEAFVPEFGLAEVKYPYTREDLEEADRTLRRYDRNEDGYVDREEAADSKWTHRNPFEMDLNKDNRLSRLELVQRYARRRLLSGDSDELFRKARRTGNGIRPSSREEEEREDRSQWWRNGGNRYWLTASVLGRFDLNKNGRLEMDEVTKVGIPPGRIDADRDGEVSRDELHAFLTEMQDAAGELAEGLPGWFYELDANRDQQVSMAEFATEPTEEKFQEFALLDANGDGLLTTTEVIQSKSLVGGSYLNESAEVLPPRKTIISEIEIDEDYTIGDLNVVLSITHSHVSYLDGYLTGPEGQRVELFAETGGSGDNFEDTILDDQSRYPISKARPPYKGSFIPLAVVKRQPGLSQFNGKNIKGVWQLVIRGTRNDRFGMLHSWGLVVKPQDNMLDAGTETGRPTESPSSASSAWPAQERSAVSDVARQLNVAFASRKDEKNDQDDDDRRKEKWQAKEFTKYQKEGDKKSGGVKLDGKNPNEKKLDKQEYQKILEAKRSLEGRKPKSKDYREERSSGGR